MTAGEKLYLSAIHVRDFRAIESFSARLGQVAIIIGENDTGKTTLLDSISSIFEGGYDPDDVRLGREQAEIVLELSNGVVAKKTITRTGYELTVRTPDGGIVRAPATWLKNLAPGLSFNPLAFLESDPRERAAFLLKTLPLHFSAAEVNQVLGGPVLREGVNLQRLNEIRQGKYEERLEINRAIRDFEGSIADLRKALPAADEKTDWAAERDRLTSQVAEIAGRIETTAAEIETSRLDAINEIETTTQAKITERRTTTTAQIAELEREFNRRKHELELQLEQENHADAQAFAERVNEINGRAAAVRAEKTATLEREKATLSLDLGTARTRAEQAAAASGVRKAIAERQTKLQAKAGEGDRLTQIIQDIDTLKHHKLRDLQIEGLDLTTDPKGRPVIRIDGIPLDKRNRQTQLYIAIQAVSLASGIVPFMICEVAELDDTHLVEVAAAIEQAKAQFICARWANGMPLRVMSLEEYRETFVPA